MSRLLCKNEVPVTNPLARPSLFPHSSLSCLNHFELDQNLARRNEVAIAYDDFGDSSSSGSTKDMFLCVETVMSVGRKGEKKEKKKAHRLHRFEHDQRRSFSNNVAYLDEHLDDFRSCSHRERQHERKGRQTRKKTNASAPSPLPSPSHLSLRPPSRPSSSTPAS
jgi:hypothetical protein